MYEGIETLAKLICWGLFFYKWLIIIAIVLTWVSADLHNPIVQWVNKVTHPLWQQIRKIGRAHV